MRSTLIQAAYALGRPDVELAMGPIPILRAGAADALRSAGHDVEVETVEVADRDDDNYWNEIEGTFAVVRLVADRVREATERGSLPLVLATNCINSVGIVAGASSDLGVVWFDAHPDFSTTEESRSGFLDGMGLSVLTGTGWNALRATVPGYRAVREESVVLVGVRDAWEHEQEHLAGSGISVVPPNEIGEGLVIALDALRERVTDVYLHLDLDVLDPSEGTVNIYAAEGGPSASDVAAAIKAVRQRFRIRAAAVTAYDPGADPEGRVPPTAVRLLVEIAAAAARERAVTA
jgi:arginase